MTDWTEQREEQQAQGRMSPCCIRSIGHYYDEPCYSIVWYGKEGDKDRGREWFMFCEQTHIWRGESKEEWAEMCNFIVIQCHGDVWLGFLPESMSRFMALIYPQSMWLSKFPDIIKGRKHSAVQRWPCHKMATTLGRTVPAPHRLKHSGERTLHLTWTTE